jgi:hypothetical protein
MANTNPTGMPGDISGKIPVESEKPTGLGQKPTSFETHMEGPSGAPKGVQLPPSGAAPAHGASPIDIAKPAGQTSPPSLDSLMNQAKSAQDGLGTIGKQLQDPNLKLKRSQSQLLKHKLQDATGHIRSAGDKAGVPAPKAQKPLTGSSPAARFLGMIGQGQDDLMAVQQQIKTYSANPEKMNAADMMFMQVKMNQAQQEIEYSSLLLGKVIESFKQVLNIQL